MREWDAALAAGHGNAVLEGQRIALTPVREGDFEAFYSWWLDPATQMMQHDALRAPSRESVEHLWTQWNKNDDGSGQSFAVRKRGDDDIIGHVALFGASLPHRCATFGIVMSPGARGQGLGADAMRTFFRFGFDEMGLHRIQLQVFAYNSWAISSYRKAGFVEEGRRRQAIWRGGQWHDEVQMGMLREDFDASPRV